MKIINLGLFLLFLGYANLAHATYYWLDFDDQEMKTAIADSRGSWSDWADCEDIHGYGQSAPRGFFLWELGNNANNDKALISCRTVESDGTFESGSNFTWSDPFFDLADVTGTRSETQTSMDKLPVGMAVHYYDSGADAFTFLESEADEITEGDEVLYDEADSSATSYGSQGLLVHISWTDEIVCDDGYVVTGIKVKYRQANWPYTGYIITGVALHCTALHEQVF